MTRKPVLMALILAALALLGVSVLAGEPAKVVQKDRYRVEVKGAAAAPGQEATWQLVLKARGEFKFNKKYPTKITLKAPEELSLVKGLLKKADAEHPDEKTATFPIRFKPGKAGDFEITATAKFSVCSKSNCIMANETFSWKVPVK